MFKSNFPAVVVEWSSQTPQIQAEVMARSQVLIPLVTKEEPRRACCAA